MMNDTVREKTFSEQLTGEMPYLRRYARALTGSQARGDSVTVATLKSILSDRSPFENTDPVKVNLFKCFHTKWVESEASHTEPEDALRGRTHALLSALTTNSREALLLRTIEEFSMEHIGKIMEIDPSEVRELITTANSELMHSVQGRVMVIEDEPIIAADLSAIVQSLGHDVTGIARTHAEAVRHGEEAKPDLILADIQLADNSSGIDAVNDLLGLMDVPVIFITAFPERLLTGDRPEPAFLISKPFQEEQVRSAVSQAMFFASTATLKA